LSGGERHSPARNAPTIGGALKKTEDGVKKRKRFRKGETPGNAPTIDGERRTAQASEGEESCSRRGVKGGEAFSEIIPSNQIGTTGRKVYMGERIKKGGGGFSSVQCNG